MLRSTPLLAALGSLATVSASQDSVSFNGCLPGDAVSPYADASAAFGSEQCNSFVVDLAPISTSWGTTFGMGPITKASKTTATFLGSLPSAQSISNVQALGVPFLSDSYDQWSFQGEGVNNDPSIQSFPINQIDTSSAFGHRAAVAFSEFSTTDGGVSYNGIVSNVLHFDPTNPGRLYVDRVVAAINGCNDSANYSQFGVGAVDNDGNVFFRADSFGATGGGGCGLQLVTNNNYFSANASLRNCDVLNVIDDQFLTQLGAFDTPAVVMGAFQYPNTLVTPSAVPASVAGGQAIFLGSDFGDNFVRGASVASLAIDQSHLAAGVTATRGNLSYSASNFAFLGSEIGTAAIIGRNAAAENKILNIWGLDAAGNVSGKIGLTLPSSISDCSTGFVRGDTGPDWFAHTFSQTPFRGGNGQISVGQDASGHLLAAAAVDFAGGGDAQHPYQYIAVARADKNTGATSWTMAAYVDQVAGGKEILDGPGGSAVGRLADLGAVTAGGLPGPSISTPMIDGMGNVWFLSGIEEFLPGGGSDFGTGLIRGVYNPTTFCYELELVLATGDVITTPGTGLEAVVSFMAIADSNSISSGGPFSGNMANGTHLAQQRSGLNPADAASLGGLALSVELIYDWDMDGDFEDCTSGQNPLSLDEDYNVMLYIGALDAGADLDGNGQADESQTLSADSTTVSASAGGTVNFSLRGGEELAGLPYFLLGSITGTSPGFPVDGLVLPLNLDSYFLFTLQFANLPPLGQSSGVLNANGRANASFTLAAGSPATLAGATVNHAWLALEIFPVPKVIATSNPWAFTIQP